jgi:hypothetical protein
LIVLDDLVHIGMAFVFKLGGLHDPGARETGVLLGGFS